MTDTHPERRIDQIKADGFIGDLETMPIAELRAKRNMCDSLDKEYAYYRRMLHGRLDLLSFELRRRTGDEERSLIEALPEILAGPHGDPNPGARPMGVELPDLPDIGRRGLDKVMADDFVSHIGDFNDEELEEIRRSLAEAEQVLSDDRRVVFESYDKLQTELARRYREGLADPSELISGA
ncbi:MAG: hypothetical protein OES13_08145 [Acidimicrobiia bacterium]|nr:hypothetical protein [Acidimicrobiia bacterium]